MLDFKVDLKEIDKINSIDKKEKENREKNLKLFNKIGFPNKKNEDWKFSDLREIFSKNFKNFSFETKKFDQEIDIISNIEHNYIKLVNGELISSDFSHEEKNKIKIKNFVNSNFSDRQENNPLINLNHALSNKGFYLEVEDNYKLNKIIVIYNYFTENLNENFLNSSNMIKLGKNSELHTIDFLVNKSKKHFFNNVHERLVLEDHSIFKNIYINNEKNNGYFHKYSKNTLSKKSRFSSFIFSSGPKFNKLDLEFDLNDEYCECNIQAASLLEKNDHQEIKTKINHLAPNCKSYQKVKNVLSSESKGIFQGKIFVKDIAQKTDAYQLSKAIILDETSEFNSKPELEIYADDVKCSHGSTSGSIDEDSIHYLMTRGLTRKESVELLISGFLNEIIDNIKSNSIRKFVKNNLENQLYANKKY